MRLQLNKIEAQKLILTAKKKRTETRKRFTTISYIYAAKGVFAEANNDSGHPVWLVVRLRAVRLSRLCLYLHNVKRGGLS